MNMSQYEKIGEWQKRKVIVAIVLALLVLAGLVFFLNRDNGPQFFGEEKTIQTTEPGAGEIVVVGKVECLPYKPESGALDEACVLGLRGDDGKMYALNAPRELNAKVGDQVRAVGKYTLRSTTSDEAAVFTYDGVIDVRVFNKI